MDSITLSEFVSKIAVHMFMNDKFNGLPQTEVYSC